MSAGAPPTRQALAGRALRVGLTGGIASGKSTVAQLFGAQAVPVIDTDQIARALVAPGTALLLQLFDRFGEHLRRPDGSLDRLALRRLVFEDAGQRRALEALLHPAIRERTEALATQLGGPYQIHVIPLLLETRGQARYDRVLVVDCPEALQLARLQSRDGCDAQQARAMLAAQTSRAARLAAADDVILNDAEPAALAPQVAVLHRKYLQLARSPGRTA
jgi:dephospho-CoA kinase